MLEVKDLVENNENDMPIAPDPGQTEECIFDVGSPSQFLQLDSFEGSVTITLKHIIQPFACSNRLVCLYVFLIMKSFVPLGDNFAYPTQLLNPGLFQPETVEAYTENLNSRLEVCHLSLIFVSPVIMA